VPAGTFTLRARVAPMIETDVRLVVQRGIDPEPVELVLPALAVFEGRLSWPAGKAVSGVSLMFEALLSEPEQTKFQTFNPLEIPVRDDGTFGAGLPECTGRVALRLPRFTLPRGPYSASSNNGPERVLDLVTLEASTPTRRDFDMSAHVPTRFAVEATVAGRVVPSLVVEARATFDATGPLAGCAVDFEGRGVSSALFPGEYCIVVRSASGSWRYALPGKLRLEPDHVPELKIDVPLVAGSLRVIWTENQLPVTQTVYIDHVAPHFEVAFATPDARGDLKLELAPGTYILRRGESRAPFEWSESGPQRSEIRLRK
jgi:hypothetical protein